MDKKIKEDLLAIHAHDLSKIDFREQFIEEYNTCCLCGTDLYFTHVTDFVAFGVEEESWCPSCNIRHQKRDHSLQ